MEHTFVLHQNRLVSIGGKEGKSVPSSASSSPVADSVPSPTIDSQINTHQPRAGTYRRNPSEYIPTGGAPAQTNTVLSPTPRSCPQWYSYEQAPFDSSAWSSPPSTQFQSHPQQYMTAPIQAMPNSTSPPSPEVTAPIGFTIGNPDYQNLSYSPGLPQCDWNTVGYGGYWNDQAQAQRGQAVWGTEDWSHSQGLCNWQESSPQQTQVNQSAQQFEYNAVYGHMRADGTWSAPPGVQRQQQQHWAPY